ncbi:uncharacterized protein ARMOST_21373 [Armillaria ostoyae]|uniref:Uncharacterized protein n=1 Tax=Armillaria ostoyae TaxID=47428 RepID=A0A284S9X4_ARMOS|nr:uncharacterized protein ARMOST_21373 [Armillaria ostoyae]
MRCSILVPPPSISLQMVFECPSSTALPPPAISHRLPWDVLIQSFESQRRAPVFPVTVIPTSNISCKHIAPPSFPTTYECRNRHNIPKPRGEIQKTYTWKDIGLEDDFRAINNMVKHEVDATLDTGVSYAANKLKNWKKMQIIRSKVSDAYPVLLGYVQQWPVDDMMKIRLKYKSERSRAARKGRVAETYAKLVASLASPNRTENPQVIDDVQSE